MILYLRIAATVLPLLAGGGAALAQTPTLPDRPAPSGANDKAHVPGSLPDQNAKQEPTAKTNPDTAAPAGVLVNGALAVPGAPARTETTPAKFSAETDARDRIPIMARGLGLSDAQKRQIAEAVRQTGASSADVKARPAMELSADAELREWPSGVASRIPAVIGTKYVLATDRILIVQPSNRIVIGEIGRP